MAKDKLTEYSATNASNDVIGDISVAEGMLPSAVNNALREQMTHLKNFSDGTDAIDALAVDNLKLDGNTISSTDTNGNVNIDPDGTGETVIDSSVRITKTSGAPTLLLTDNDTSGDGTIDASDGNLRFYSDNDGEVAGSLMGFYVDGSERMRIDSSGSVGIGTSSPAFASGSGLEIEKSDTATLRVERTSATAAAGEFFAGNDKIVIGSTSNTHFQFRTNGTERMRVDSSGAVLIGKTSLTSNDAGLELNTGPTTNVARVDHHKTASGDFAGYYFFHNGSNVGGIDYSNSAVNYATSSDHRLKENVADMTGAITRVKALTPKRFNFIIDPDTTVDGFLAHEAQTVVPEAVRGTHNEVDDDGNAVMQGIDQSKLVPLLTGALQEAIAKIETLETQRADIETRLAALEA